MNVFHLKVTMFKFHSFHRGEEDEIITITC